MPAHTWLLRTAGWSPVAPVAAAVVGAAGDAAVVLDRRAASGVGLDVVDLEVVAALVAEVVEALTEIADLHGAAVRAGEEPSPDADVDHP